MTQTIRAYDDTMFRLSLGRTINDKLDDPNWQAACILKHSLMDRRDKRDHKRRLRQAKRVSRAYGQAIIRR